MFACREREREREEINIPRFKGNKSFIHSMNGGKRADGQMANRTVCLSRLGNLQGKFHGAKSVTYICVPSHKLERCVSYQQATVICFVDFAAAFDCVDWVIMASTKTMGCNSLVFEVRFTARCSILS